MTPSWVHCGKEPAVCLVASTMTSLADRAVPALRANHDILAALVPAMSEENLNNPSGATGWSRAGALAHG
ncbi:hypothetical protein GCM10009845_38870 [Pedococcus bigeumensis]